MSRYTASDFRQAAAVLKNDTPWEMISRDELVQMLTYAEGLADELGTARAQILWERGERLRNEPASETQLRELLGRLTDRKQCSPTDDEDCGYQDVECWKRQLVAAGWREKTTTIWRDPNGKLHAGPHGAWKAMRAQRAALLDQRAPPPKGSAMTPTPEAIRRLIERLNTGQFQLFEVTLALDGYVDSLSVLVEMDKIIGRYLDNHYSNADAEGMSALCECKLCLDARAVRQKLRV